jgi:hypothetical protein
MLPPFCATIKPVDHAALWFAHLKCGLSATSRLKGENDRGLDLIGDSLDGPDEPFLFWFHC